MGSHQQLFIMWSAVAVMACNGCRAETALCLLLPDSPHNAGDDLVDIYDDHGDVKVEHQSLVLPVGYPGQVQTGLRGGRPRMIQGGGGRA